MGGDGSPRREELLAARLRKLPRARTLGHEVRVATTLRARLLGLAFLDRSVAKSALLIPRCRCIHTFGMRFSVRIWFLGGDGEVVSARSNVPPRRVVRDRGATAVLELPCTDSQSGAGRRA